MHMIFYVATNVPSRQRFFRTSLTSHGNSWCCHPARSDFKPSYRPAGFYSTTRDPAALEKSRILLGLNTRFSARQLKQAYYENCKRIHPDVSPLNKVEANERFIEISTAFDVLHKVIDSEETPEKGVDEDHDMTEDEERAYRRSCSEWLSVSAELVEESKAHEGFRQWLLGKTDAAEYWRCFLLYHGGLLPKRLRKIEELSTGSIKLRRKKK